MEPRDGDPTTVVLGEGVLSIVEEEDIFVTTQPTKFNLVEGNGKVILRGQEHFSTHPYYVGVQYHPEFLSRPLSPSPPFLGLILASCRKLRSYLEKDGLEL
jgi:hypothetical protein